MSEKHEHGQPWATDYMLRGLALETVEAKLCQLVDDLSMLCDRAEMAAKMPGVERVGIKPSRLRAALRRVGPPYYRGTI